MSEYQKVRHFFSAVNVYKMRYSHLDVTLSFRHISCSKIQHTSILATPSGSGQRHRGVWLLWRHSSSDSESGSRAGSGATSSGGGDNEGRPVCPHCGEPSTFTGISELVLKIEHVKNATIFDCELVQGSKIARTPAMLISQTVYLLILAGHAQINLTNAKIVC